LDQPGVSNRTDFLEFRIIESDRKFNLSSKQYQKVAPEAVVLGNSFLGQPIVGWDFYPFQSESILILGAVHGDEVESIWLVNSILEKLLAKSTWQSRGTRLFLIPCLNPDGTTLNTRWNYNKVDLNRNLPTSNWQQEASNVRYPPGPKPASEVETQVLLSVINSIQPKLIVSVHSFSKSLLLFPQSVESQMFSEPVMKMAGELDIPVVETMDYKIYGSLSAYGRENGIPTLTVEVLRGLSMEEVIDLYSSPFITLIKETSLCLELD
jgi:protein MpaA